MKEENKTVINKLKILGYDTRWLTYGYFTIEELNTQYSLYNEATTNPKSMEAQIGYQHTEHLRYRQFCKIFEKHKTLTAKQVREIAELIEADEDQVMSYNFYQNLENTKNNLKQKDMNKTNIELPLLGKIKLEESDWEYKYGYNLTEYQFETLKIDIDVNFKNINNESIPKVSKALNELNSLNKIGEKGIVQDFNNNGESEFYIIEWKDDIFKQILNKDEFENFISDTDSNLKIENRLLNKLKLVRLGIYAESNINFVTLDYAFGYEFEKGYRDNMLVVKLDQNFKITDISTEG